MSALGQERDMIAKTKSQGAPGALCEYSRECDRSSRFSLFIQGDAQLAIEPIASNNS